MRRRSFSWRDESHALNSSAFEQITAELERNPSRRPPYNAPDELSSAFFPRIRPQAYCDNMQILQEAR